MYVYILRVCYTFFNQYSFLPRARHDFIQNIRVRVNSEIVIHPSTGGRRRHPRSFSKQPEGAKRTSRATLRHARRRGTRALSTVSRTRASHFFSLPPPAVVSAAITPRTPTDRPDDVRKDDARRRPRSRSLGHPMSSLGVFATAFATGSRARRRREMFRCIRIGRRVVRSRR